MAPSPSQPRSRGLIGSLFRWGLGLAALGLLVLAIAVGVAIGLTVF